MSDEMTDILTAEDREIINQFQILQQQLQGILIQKENVKLQRMELEKALEELNKKDLKEAYKISGPIMIKRDIQEIKKEIQEKMDDMEIRLKTIDATEDKITKRLKEIEPKIKRMIGQ